MRPARPCPRSRVRAKASFTSCSISSPRKPSCLWTKVSQTSRGYALFLAVPPPFFFAFAYCYHTFSSSIFFNSSTPFFGTYPPATHYYLTAIILSPISYRCKPPSLVSVLFSSFSNDPIPSNPSSLVVVRKYPRIIRRSWWKLVRIYCLVFVLSPLTRACV